MRTAQLDFGHKPRLTMAYFDTAFSVPLPPGAVAQVAAHQVNGRIILKIVLMENGTVKSEMLDLGPICGLKFQETVHLARLRKRISDAEVLKYSAVVLLTLTALEFVAQKVGELVTLIRGFWEH